MKRNVAKKKTSKLSILDRPGSRTNSEDEGLDEDGNPITVVAA